MGPYQSEVDQVFTKVSVVEIQPSAVRIMEATNKVENSMNSGQFEGTVKAHMKGQNVCVAKCGMNTCCVQLLQCTCHMFIVYKFSIIYSILYSIEISCSTYMNECL